MNSGSLYGLTSLTQLFLSNNSIAHINPDGLKFCQRLRELWVPAFKWVWTLRLLCQVNLCRNSLAGQFRFLRVGPKLVMQKNKPLPPDTPPHLLCHPFSFPRVKWHSGLACLSHNQSGAQQHSSFGQDVFLSVLKRRVLSNRRVILCCLCGCSYT